MAANLIRRLLSLCPLWHASDPLWARNDQGQLILECTRCGRPVTTVLPDQRLQVRAPEFISAAARGHARDRARVQTANAAPKPRPRIWRRA